MTDAAAYLPLLRSLARRWTRDVDAADDLVQEALERWVRYGHAVDDCILKSWLVRVMRNRHIDRERHLNNFRHGDTGRHSRVEIAFAPDELAMKAGVVAPAQEMHIALREMDAAVARLKPSCQRAVIAAAMGEVPRSLQSSLCRARQQLREMLDA